MNTYKKPYEDVLSKFLNIKTNHDASKGISKIKENITNVTHPKSKTGQIVKSSLQVLDPTGISSYPDVYDAGVNMYNNPSWGNAGNLALETLGALPLIGKVAKPIKLIKSSTKTMEGLNKATKGINKAVDTIPEIFPVVRKLANNTQNFTSKNLSQPLFDKLAKNNYKGSIYTNIGIDVLNGANSTNDIKGLIDNIYK